MSLYRSVESPTEPPFFWSLILIFSLDGSGSLPIQLLIQWRPQLENVLSGDRL